MKYKITITSEALEDIVHSINTQNQVHHAWKPDGSGPSDITYTRKYGQIQLKKTGDIITEMVIPSTSITSDGEIMHTAEAMRIPVVAEYE